MESDSSNADIQCPEKGVNEGNPKCFHLFNCDEIYQLDVVEKLLKNIESKLNFDISIQKRYFDLWKMTELSDSIIPELQMDFAIFVVHANEPRLSINEENAGFGYTKVYRALLQATDGKVIIVIGGDDNYKNSDEEQSAVLSHWARRKIFSQFNEEFMDGRKSFIFSWDKEHRPIHEDALLHFLDPNKKGDKFVPKPNVEPTVAPENPLKTVKFQERSETDVKATKNERDYPGIQTQISEDQKPQTGYEQEKPVSMLQPPPTDDNEPHSFEIMSPRELQEAEEYMETSDECGNLQPAEVPKEDPLTKPEPPRQQQVDTSASSLRETVAILCRPDQSDIPFIMDVFGVGFIPGKVPVTSSDPSSLKDLLLANSVRSCYISVEARKMKEELQKKSRRSLYEDLLKAARHSVERKVVVILHNKGSCAIPSHEEDSITARIEEFLGEKGIILWWKGNTSCLQTKRSQLNISQSCPGDDDAAKTPVKKEGSGPHVSRPINPEEFTLIFKTRLRHGRISYDAKDVLIRLEGWVAPQGMADNLLKWESTINAELLVYREIKTGNEVTVVNKDIGTIKDAFVGSSVVETAVAGIMRVGERQ